MITGKAPMDPAPDLASRESSREGLRSSLYALLASRGALIRLELRQLLRSRVRGVAYLVIAAILIFFTWALFLAGSIAAISISSHWPWHLVALGFAALHLIAAVVLVLSASHSSKGPSFPVTRSEFKKDCEWLEGLQNKTKSGD